MSTVIVLGSTGSVGVATIKALSTVSPSTKILAGVRDPTSTKAADLKAIRNVTVVRADLSKPETLTAAIPIGVDAVYINTPGDEQRTQQAINGINAAKNAKAKALVVLSVASVDEGGIFAKQFLPIEKAAKKAGVPYTIVRLPLFIDNNWANQASIKNQGKIYGPTNPNAKVAPIAVADAGEAFANILAKPKAHKGKTYRLATRPYSHTELAAAFSKATGKQVDYVQVPYDAAKQAFLGLGFPEWQTDGVLELLHHVDSQAKYYRPSRDFRTITGRDPTTIEQWTAQVGSAFK